MKFDTAHFEIFSQQTQTKTKELSKNKQQNIGHWTDQEHKLYLDFLYNSQDQVETIQKSKGQRFFKKMSQNIVTRSPSQCRSHHQKFNPFVVQGKFHKTTKKIRQSNKQSYLNMRSKQYIRQLFQKLRNTRSESISEEELDQSIQ
ncbi:unnamed protein product [Paramecium pentaurelia]|uniref:Myb-like domain-containing protein n=1 Tax=Paramecium pentaurelia TaxID=43138 RepID=A0A8S1SKI5_9CILI|nr:unnamed protein product [Paramecium pentaurelia]